MSLSLVSEEICLCHIKPSSEPSTATQTTIVDVMGVVRMISIENSNPLIFLLWTKKVFFIYLWPSRRQLTFGF